MAIQTREALDSFTDAEALIMICAGGGFDYSHSAQTAIEEVAHIILGADVVNTGSSAAHLLVDPGYRSEAVKAELVIIQPNTELLIAPGCEGKVLANPQDAQRHPLTVAMAGQFETEQRNIDYRKRKWIAELPNE